MHRDIGVKLEIKNHKERSAVRSDIVVIFCRMLYLFLGMLGFCYTFLSVFPIVISPGWLNLALVGLTVIFVVFFSTRKSLVIFLPIVCLLHFLGCWYFSEELAGGLCNILNTVIDKVNFYYSFSVPKFAAPAVTAGQQFAGFFVVFLFFAYVIALGVVYYADIFTTVLAVLFPTFLALLIGEVPDAWALMACVASILGVNFLKQIRRERKKDRQRQAFFGKKYSSQFLLMTLVITITVFVAGLCVNPILTTAFGDRAAVVQELRDEIRNGGISRYINKLGRQINQWGIEWLPFDIVAKSGVSGGKLGNIAAVESTGEIALKVSVSKDMPDNLYLRGYIGTNYTGDGWEEINEEQQERLKAYGLNEMGDVLLAGRYGAGIPEGLTFYRGSINSNVVSDKVIVEVENVSANENYLYAPYVSLIDEGAYEAFFDAALIPYRAEMHRYQMLHVNYQSEFAFEQIRDLKEKSGNSANLDVYEQFVRETYLDIPAGMEELCAAFPPGDYAYIPSAIQYVQKWLVRGREYSRSSGALPDGKDYITYFLFENRKGACTHFASSAVIIFRMMGIPARYVEGYIVNEPKAGAVNEVKDETAHAWPEIFIAGYGWIPIEVTPGFLDTSVTYQEEERPVQSEVENEKPSASPTQEPTRPSEEGHESKPVKQEEETPGQVGQSADYASLRPILYGVGTVAIVVLLFYIRYRILVNKKKKRLVQKPAKAVGAAYAMFCEGARFAGVLINESMSAAEVVQHFPWMQEEQYEALRNSILEAAYSNHEVTKEQRTAAIEFYREFCYKTISQLSTFKRRWYYYILCNPKPDL